MIQSLVAECTVERSHTVNKQASIGGNARILIRTGFEGLTIAITSFCRRAGMLFLRLREVLNPKIGVRFVNVRPSPPGGI